MKRTKKTVLAIIACIFVALIPLLILLNYAISYWIVPSNAIKKAILLSDLGTQDYVICSPISTTGFEWEVEESNLPNINKNDLFNVIGPSPQDLPLKYEVITLGQNKFIFYVEDIQHIFNAEMQEDLLTLTVSDWDILYPVGRDFNMFSSRWYLTENDVHRRD